MKQAIFLILVVVATVFYNYSPKEKTRQSTAIPTSYGRSGTTSKPSQNFQSGQQVSGEGTVSKLLKDDLDGSRHQKFILTLSSGRTLLIAHNIDIAPRISSLSMGDKIQFYGVYETNSHGGVIHWTHRDPRGSHVHGWLKKNGTLYQ